MAKYSDTSVLESLVELQIAEIDDLKNTYGAAIIDLQAEQIDQGVDIADHETRITTLEP